MDIEAIEQNGFEELWRAADPDVGFTAYIAIHSTKRGPSLGGVRLWSYPNEEEAKNDALLLAQSMTYKAAVADLSYGGGKGVILQPAGDFDRAALYSRFAAFINHLEGRYITAKDVGTGPEDITVMGQQTRWVTGLPPEEGGAGDPSPMTAYGMLVGIKTSVQEMLGQEDLSGLRVVIQGLGAVGEEIGRLLAAKGCELWGSDIDPKRLVAVSQEIGIHPLLPEAVLTQEADLLCPCALGQVLNEESIESLQVKIVAGGANDQLTNPEQDAAKLKEKGILYAPDFVVNAGGLIHVATEWGGYDEGRARAKTEQIGVTLKEIYSYSKQHRTTTHAAAMRIAESRL